VYTESKLEVPTEQAQVEDFTNLDLTQGKPRCIPPKSLSFIFETLFIILYARALSLLVLDDTVDTLRSSFPIILVTVDTIVACH
jgi:hypothetical protein